MQWMTLFNKEMVENWRNKKWIWVPIVMIILCTMDPLTYYYLPEIMEMAGNVPEGLLFELPDMLPTEVILLSLEQLSMFGVLVIILITMNTIAGEKKSGITEIILVKPIKPINYVTTKWSVYSIISVLSLIIGLLTNFYYTNILYGELSFSVFLKVA